MKCILAASALALFVTTACSDGGEAAPDAAPTPDGGAQDGGGDAAASGDGGGQDASSPSEITALPNTRCALTDRLGIVEVSTAEDGDKRTHYVTSFVSTKKDPRLGNIVEQNDVCRHHRLTVVPGVFMPERPRNAKLTVVAGAQKQELTANAPTYELSDEIKLPGDTFALELRWDGLTITMPATQIPTVLQNVKERLTGTLEDPNVLTVTWTPPATDTHVYSLIPINHHAGGPTFTECLAPSAAGSFMVPKSMLTPLAVSTGLEFQGVRHLRYAAAQTPKGCIEFHYFSRVLPNIMTTP